ncbi:MAG TPA: SUMF1/EgtB/PvdO family nonheme iron enzyme [Gemmataceae bacterium]|nr:SUMF1/EgtB/PvdO family nonheme iron enzyme [Gemmataceae bacterium]
MTPEVGFLRAMQEDEDDTSCLVFADWLDEHGQPERAEFIRIQCELARWIPDLQHRTQLQLREQDLLTRHGETWIGRLQEYCLSWRFERGLAHIVMDAGRFVRRLASSRHFLLRVEELFRAALVENLRLENVREATYAPLARVGALIEVTGLDLSGGELDDEFVDGLFRSRSLGRLRSLDLSNNRLSEAGVLYGGWGSRLLAIQRVSVRNNLVQLSVVPKGSLSLHHPFFTHLDLHGNPLTEPSHRYLGTHQNGKVWHQPGRPPRLFNSLAMQFALIPAGTFLMGAPAGETGHFPNETPRHEVTLTRSFYLGLYPVTQHDYETVLGTNPSHFRSGNGGRPNHPVEDVTWEDAVRFCGELSARPEERAAGRVYRLPTEAEWEHACRAGTTTPFSWGSAAWSAQANFSGQHPYGGALTGPYLGRTSPVGSYPPNPFGLYDLHGNVWEWCNDWYDKDYYEKSPRKDPPGPRKGHAHVLRGGSWYIVGRGIRCAERCYTSEAPVTHAGTIGFRVAMTLRG